jgi:hypothetical protein
MSDAWTILSQDTYNGIISGMVYGPHTVRAVLLFRLILETVTVCLRRMFLFKISSLLHPTLTT